MSLCRTCEYALYDGMCMAHGKFTLLDASACDDYKMHLDVEVSHLKAENAKLREQIHWLKRGDVLHVLTDQELADQQKHEREMQASITALDAENAKLREERNHWHVEQVHAYSNWEDTHKRATELELENSKLRELVRELRVCLKDECNRCHEWGDACDLEHQMHELGVVE